MIGMHENGRRSIYFGGLFTSVNVAAGTGALPTNRIARWACPDLPTCYANCDDSTTPPALNVADFTCFLQKFAAGCP